MRNGGVKNNDRIDAIIARPPQLTVTSAANSVLLAAAASRTDY